MKTIIEKINNNDKNMLLLSGVLYMLSMFTCIDILFVTSLIFFIGMIVINFKNDTYNKEITFNEIIEMTNKDIDRCFESGRVIEGFIKTVAFPLCFIGIFVAILMVIVLLL